MKILFFLFIFSINLYSEDDFLNKDTEEISKLIESVKNNNEAEILNELKEEHNYSIINNNLDNKKKDSTEKIFIKDSFLNSDFKDYTGEAGSWLFNVLYETHDYKTGPRKHGVSIEYAWVYDLRYVAFHAISNLSYYKGYYDKKGFIPLGFGAELLIGIPSAMFFSAHYVFEYAKQEAGSYINFTRYGFGIYFNLSNLNKNSQFQMYKNHKIRRTYFIVKYNIRNTKDDIDFYSKNSINLGFGFEY